MFFHVFFLLNIVTGSAIGYSYKNSTAIYNVNYDFSGVFRYPRKIPKPLATGLYKPETWSCEGLDKTAQHPFVVIILYITSGRFLGMGSILARETILTARKVVKKSMQYPHKLFVLAGRISPWWGKGSQVKRVRAIYVNDWELAILRLEEPLNYNVNVMPIGIAQPPYSTDFPTFTERFSRYFTAFGVPRQGFNNQGEPTQKSATYYMKLERSMDWTSPSGRPHINCTNTFPYLTYYKREMMCTYSNASYCWGCLGSPTVTFAQDTKRFELVGVLIAATTTEVEQYHMHLKLDPFVKWIKSLTPLNFLKEVDKITV